MKKYFFLILLINLLFNSGSNLYANVSKDKIHPVKERFSKNNHIKASKEDQTIFVFDEINIDFEEEFHENNPDNSNENKFLVLKSNFLQNWYISNAKLFKLNISNNRFEIFSPFSGYSNPIYISIQVLKI
jgi:hypothetical protein